MKKVTITLAILLALSVSTFAQVPRTISFQGVLTDASGNLIPDGNHTLTLKLYDNVASPTPIFTEAQTVPVVKGIFNVIIGSVTALPASLAFDRAYFLGVSVNGGTELLPRSALTAVPYALRADRANIAEALAPTATGAVTSINNQSGALTLQGGGGTTVTNAGNAFTISSTGGGTGIQSVQSTDNTITILNPNGPVANLGIAANAITNNKIASGQVVKSLNGLFDNVTLTAGANVTLTPSGSSITIASSGGSGGTGIQTLQNTNSTLEITNPSGPTTTVNIGASAIKTEQIVDNAVTSAKIADASVTPEKISSTGATSGQVLSYNGSNVTWSSMSSGGGTLDQAYDFGGKGNGRTINADSGAVIIAGEDGFYATGTYGKGEEIEVRGPGTRMFLYPRMAAFRAGYADNDQWDDYGMGDYSIAMGHSTIANADYTFAVGFKSMATGIASAAIGDSAEAKGWYSYAIGNNARVTGNNAVSIGERTLTTGNSSTSMGSHTKASGNYATAIGYYADAGGNNAIAIGFYSDASGNNATALGDSTEASGNYTTAMGSHTTASGNYATAMGSRTTADGNYSTAMGSNTIASGNYSTAMGSYASTNLKEGAFAIGDKSTQTLLTIPVINQFRARFANGYFLYTNSAMSTGASLESGASSWSSISDSTRKEKYQAANADAYLKRFRDLRLGSWSYIGDGKRHLGPMAQEWFSAFGYDGIGTIGNDTTLASADVDGVLCIAIQALEKRTGDQKEIITKQEAELNELRFIIAGMKSELAELRNRSNPSQPVETKYSHK